MIGVITECIAKEGQAAHPVHPIASADHEASIDTDGSEGLLDCQFCRVTSRHLTRELKCKMLVKAAP